MLCLLGGPLRVGVQIDVMSHEAAFIPKLSYTSLWKLREVEAKEKHVRVLLSLQHSIRQPIINHVDGLREQSNRFSPPVRSRSAVRRRPCLECRHSCLSFLRPRFITLVISSIGGINRLCVCSYEDIDRWRDRESPPGPLRVGRFPSMSSHFDSRYWVRMYRRLSRAKRYAGICQQWWRHHK